MRRRTQLAGAGGGAWHDMQAVPAAGEFAAAAGVEVSRVAVADAEFGAELTRAILLLLGYTHARRYGRAPEWREGLPAFLCGGGANCEVYANSLASAFKGHGVPLLRTPFPLLEEATRLKGVGEQNFHRLSVAYGLTFDAESIGRILAPHEIEDAPRFDPKADVYRERPDRDDLYPK